MIAFDKKFNGTLRLASPPAPTVPLDFEDELESKLEAATKSKRIKSVENTPRQQIKDIADELARHNWTLAYVSASGSHYFVAPNGRMLRLADHPHALDRLMLAILVDGKPTMKIERALTLGARRG